jgi:hypothetical protein
MKTGTINVAGHKYEQISEVYSQIPGEDCDTTIII